jgi:hypothetical protein
VSLPTADDLFRPTAVTDDVEEAAPSAAPVAATPRRVAAVPEPAARKKAPAKTPAQAPSQRSSSGRVRHDEKMTVYVTADELLDIEHARLALRRDHGLAVDRGRLVREALAIALAELEQHGDESELVRRLIG